MLTIITSKTGKNIGQGAKTHNPKLDKGGFLIPVGNAIITEANMADAATLEAFINAQLHHNDPTLRWHMVGPFKGFNDLTKEAVVVDDDYGGAHIAEDVKYILEYKLLNGKWFHQMLRTFNNEHENYLWMPFDSSWTLQGTYHPDLDATGKYQMTGYTLDMLFSPGYKKSNYNALIEYKFMIGHEDMTESNDEYYAVELPFNPLKLKGVQEVELINVTPDSAAAGVFHVKPVAGGVLNMAVGALGTILAAVDAWIVTDKATGAELTLTSVAKNVAGDALIITVDTTDTDYDNGPGAANINLEPVGDLSTLGAKYYANSLPLEVITT